VRRLMPVITTALVPAITLTLATASPPASAAGTPATALPCRPSGAPVAETLARALDDVVASARSRGLAWVPRPSVVTERDHGPVTRSAEPDGYNLRPAVRVRAVHPRGEDRPG
jgi:hypothetical protein